MERREFLRRSGRLAVVGSVLPLAVACTRSSSAPSVTTSTVPSSTPPPSTAVPTATAGPATDADWAAFGRMLKGTLVRPTSASYATAKQLFQPRFDSIHPQAVVECASVADVQHAIAFARQHSIRIAPRSGGHSYAGYSSGPGMVIDVTRLSHISVDAATGVATVGAGARLIDVYHAMAGAGRAMPGGTCPTVGIAGLALGGGQGVVGRKYGLTCDAMTSVQIVDADGRSLQCDAAHNPDLFWASRGGGGGNFGIATSFTFRTAPLTHLVTFTLNDEKYYALGSGPARAMATKLKDGKQEPVEELYKELGYQDEADATVLVIENDAIPPVAIVEKVAAACKVDPSKLTIIVTPTSSLAGGVQVVARVLEVAMHKAHALHFPLENIVDGSGSAPDLPAASELC